MIRGDTLNKCLREIIDCFIHPVPVILMSLIVAVCVLGRLVSVAVGLDRDIRREAMEAIKLQVLNGANATLWNIERTADLDTRALQSVFGSVLQTAQHVCTNISKESHSGDNARCSMISTTSLNETLSIRKAVSHAHSRLARLRSRQMCAQDLTYARAVQVNDNGSAVTLTALSFLLFGYVIIAVMRKVPRYNVSTPRGSRAKIGVDGEKDASEMEGKPRPSDVPKLSGPTTLPKGKHFRNVLNNPIIKSALLLILFLSIICIWGALLLSALAKQYDPKGNLDQSQVTDFNKIVQDIYFELLSQLQYGHAELSAALNLQTLKQLSSSGLPSLQVHGFEPIDSIAVEDFLYATMTVSTEVSVLNVLRTINSAVTIVDVVAMCLIVFFTLLQMIRPVVSSVIKKRWA